MHYIPVHTQPYYQAMGFAEGDFPQTERYYREAISLPLYPTLTTAEQDRVVAALREGFEKLVASGKSYVFSVTRFAFPIQRTIRQALQLDRGEA